VALNGEGSLTTGVEVLRTGVAGRVSVFVQLVA